VIVGAPRIAGALLTSVFLLIHAIDANAADVISIAGSWQFELNGPKSSDFPGALPKLNLNDAIDLPGTTESREKGQKSAPGWNGQLTRLYRFDGSAWYQRDVEIPPDWLGKRVVLFLERTKYTQVWVDDKTVGEGTIFCTPQEFLLGPLAPGRHRITIVVDNTRLPIDTEAHQWSDNTQTNWNCRRRTVPGLMMCRLIRAPGSDQSPCAFESGVKSQAREQFTFR